MTTQIDQRLTPEIQRLIEKYRQDNLLQTITSREIALSPLHTRMDGDYKLWQLSPYVTEANYASYTSNEPRTFADKVLTWFIKSHLIIRVDPTGRHDLLQRFDASKEKLAYGLLNMADNRLRSIGWPKVRQQSAFQIGIRGPVFARCLLRPDSRGNTTVDITPWDSRSVVFAWGPEGLKWAAYKMTRTRAEIADEYPEAILPEGWLDSNDQSDVTVWDFYDEIANSTFTQDMISLKPSTPHLQPRMPIAYAFGGYAPIVADSGVGDSIKNFSESIYHADREVYAHDNEMRSIGLHLAKKSREPNTHYMSRDGTLRPTRDANLPGAEIPLSTGNDESIETIPPPELTATALQFMAQVQAQVQQGSLSPVHFGNAPFALSGFALNTLGLGSEEKIDPLVEQAEDFYLMMLEILMEQYATGRHGVLTVKGKSRDGAAFSERVPPEVVQIGGELTVEFIPQLPQDDVQKIQQAQLLRQPGVDGLPLVDDQYIRDKVLFIQDVDNMDDRLTNQMAERGSQAANIFSNHKAAKNAGREDLAQIYSDDYLMYMFQRFFATQGLLPPNLPPLTGQAEYGTPSFNLQSAGTNSSGGALGVPPNVNPPEALGIQSQPIQQQGPIVPPNTPRPGARGGFGV